VAGRGGGAPARVGPQRVNVRIRGFIRRLAD